MAKYKTSKISGFAWNYIILKFKFQLKATLIIAFAVFLYTLYTKNETLFIALSAVKKISQIDILC